MESMPIANPFPGALSYLVDSTESTQGEAKRLAETCASEGRNFPPGSLVAAQEQRAGRGRFPERSWVSEAGKNLLFTVYLDAETAHLPGLPLRIGAALCESALLYARGLGSVFSRPPQLKWPNDLMFGDKKAAGILCEAGPAGVFAGIGLNCNQMAFPPGIEEKATSLAAELGREVGRWDILELFLGALSSALGDEAWREGVEARLWRRGRAATFLPGIEGASVGGESVALIGKVEGIAEDGSLLFREDGESAARAYAAGELRAPAVC